MRSHATKAAKGPGAKGGQASALARPPAAGRTACATCDASTRNAARDDLILGRQSVTAGKPVAGRSGGGWGDDILDAVSDVGNAIATGAAAVVAALPPMLSKKTVAGPTPGTCGGYDWTVQWLLNKKTTVGGWVVQKVELPYDVKDCDDKAVDPAKVGGFQPSWTPYWEAWKINKNQQVTTYAQTGDVLDDTYRSGGPGKGTKGSLTMKGTAEFYEGLTLPSGFTVKNAAPAWILPHTTTAPALSGGTGAIAHNLTASWDCCNKDAKASQATTLVPV